MLAIRPLLPIAAATAFLSLFAPAPSPAAEVDEAVYQQINEALIDDYLLPRYDRFAEAAATLDTRAAAFCGGGAKADLQPVRSAFGEAMDAWLGLQHIGFGPAELFMRGYRIQFWPQARGKFAKAVDELLASEDASALAPEAFRNASVAAQGLPAIEQLLYGPDGEFGARDGAEVSRCDVLEAVTANVADMAEGLVADWTMAEKPFALILLQPGPDNAYFESAQDVTLAFFRSLYTGLELIQTAKLRPPLGKALAEARPELAESPLAGRSVRNIVLNLRSLRDMYEGASGGAGFTDAVRTHGDAALDELMRKAFRMTIETAESVSDPLTEAVRSEERRPRLEQLAVQVRALKQIVKTRLANALELGVGFNALDGD